MTLADGNPRKRRYIVVIDYQRGRSVASEHLLVNVPEAIDKQEAIAIASDLLHRNDRELKIWCFELEDEEGND